jgi:hypothetical protein
MKDKLDIRSIGKTKHFVRLSTPTHDHIEDNKLRSSKKSMIKSEGKKRVDYYKNTPKNERTYEQYQDYIYNMKRVQKANNSGKH